MHEYDWKMKEEAKKKNNEKFGKAKLEYVPFVINDVYPYEDTETLHEDRKNEEDELYQLNITYVHDNQICQINGQFPMERCYEIHGNLIGEIQSMIVVKVKGLNR